MKVTIIGTGHLGLTAGACFAERGHQVLCVDNQEDKIALLKAGKMPFYESGLEDLVRKNVDLEQLKFTTSLKKGVCFGEIIFIAVPTPPRPDGTVDLDLVKQVAREIGKSMPAKDSFKVIVTKSTVPVLTARKIREIIERLSPEGVEFEVVSNPEFLREGTAVDDFLYPDRIVYGTKSERAGEVMRKLYRSFDGPVFECSPSSAELIKQAANAFLTTKISFINGISEICETSGADVTEVAQGLGMDQRIGEDFLNAGIGYGGICFPKDLKGLLKTSENLGCTFNLLKEVEEINVRQLDLFLAKIKKSLQLLRGKKIAIWGLAFKAHTDDIRGSIAIKVAKSLIAEGTTVTIYEPMILALPRELEVFEGHCLISKDPYECLNDADGLAIATDWPEFEKPNYDEIKARMNKPIIFEGRNLLDPADARSQEIEYHGVGR